MCHSLCADCQRALQQTPVKRETRESAKLAQTAVLGGAGTVWRQQRQTVSDSRFLKNVQTRLIDILKKTSLHIDKAVYLSVLDMYRVERYSETFEVLSKASDPRAVVFRTQRRDVTRQKQEEDFPQLIVCQRSRKKGVEIFEDGEGHVAATRETEDVKSVRQETEDAESARETKVITDVAAAGPAARDPAPKNAEEMFAGWMRKLHEDKGHKGYRVYKGRKRYEDFKGSKAYKDYKAYEEDDENDDKDGKEPKDDTDEMLAFWGEVFDGGKKEEEKEEELDDAGALKRAGIRVLQSDQTRYVYSFDTEKLLEILPPENIVKIVQTVMKYLINTRKDKQDTIQSTKLVKMFTNALDEAPDKTFKEIVEMSTKKEYAKAYRQLSGMSAPHHDPDKTQGLIALEQPSGRTRRYWPWDDSLTKRLTGAEKEEIVTEVIQRVAERKNREHYESGGYVV